MKSKLEENINEIALSTQKKYVSLPTHAHTHSLSLCLFNKPPLIRTFIGRYEEAEASVAKGDRPAITARKFQVAKNTVEIAEQEAKSLKTVELATTKANTELERLRVSRVLSLHHNEKFDSSHGVLGEFITAR